MEPTAHYEVAGDVAVITLDNPPVNGLGSELRGGILAGLDRAEADPAIRAVLIVGNEKFFSGGADIRQFNTPKYWQPPRTIDLGERLDRARKLVVAAIGGVAMGGGLELALACHYRVALANVRLALSEVKLGLLPGGGGTLRLPRLVGVDTALDMMLSGDAVGADRAKAIGLADAIVASPLRESALAEVRALLARGAPLRRSSEIAVDAAAGLASIDRARERLRGIPAGPAAATILDVIAAGLSQSGPDVRRITDDATRALMDGPESKALRHVFFAEREAAKTDSKPAADARVERLVIAGASEAATRLAERCAALGIAVETRDTAPAASIDVRAAVHDGASSVSIALAPASGPFAVMEIAPGAAAAPVAAALALARRIGVAPVLVGRIGCTAALAESRDDMAAAGKRLVDAGDARRASDVDFIAVRALGYPAFRGGPMYAASIGA